MRTRRSLLAIALVAGSLVLWRAQPAPATGAAIALSRTSGPVGTRETVSGEGFTPLRSVSVKFHDAVDGPVVVAKAVSGRRGRFSASFRVPPNPSGPHQVVAIDATGRKSNTVPFSITAKLRVSPTGTAPKDRICVQTGFQRKGAYTETFGLTGYPAETNVRIFLISPSRAAVTALVAITNRHGSASGTYIQPQVPSGNYLARTSVGTQVLPTVVHIVSHWYTCYAFSGGARPMRWRADGVGFHPGTPVSLTWTGVRKNPIFKTVVRSDGSWGGGTFTVRCARRAGTYTVTTTGTDGQGHPIFVKTKNKLRTRCG